MSTQDFSSLKDLIDKLARDLKDRRGAVRRALRSAARRGVTVVKEEVPVAFGEIRESVHAEGSKVVVDAPHARPVNDGSRPHMPPLAPLIRWVKLRGMQGLVSKRARGRLPGSTTRGAAEGIASMLRSMEHGGSLSVDAPERVARAIQHAIAKRGTKPSHFMERSLPDLDRILIDALRQELAKPPR